MSEKNEVFEVIKSVITSQKGGVLFKDINRDYRNIAGEHIPFKSLGYRSIEEILNDIPEVHSFINGDGQVVFINKGKNCEHLVGLISKQKNTKTNLKLCNKGVKSKSWHPAVHKIVHQLPHKIVGYENTTKLHSNMHDSLCKGGITEERHEHSQENDNDTMYMKKRSVNRTDDVKKFINSAQQRNVAHSRKSDQRGRVCKQHEDHFGELPQLEDWQDDFNDSSQYQENRVYVYKFSEVLDRRKASCHGDKYNHDPRGYRRNQHYTTEPLRKCENVLYFNEDDCDITNWYSPLGSCNRSEKCASSSRPKSFRAARGNTMEDYPDSLCRDEYFYRPVVRDHYKYYRNSRCESYESSRCVPEIEDWGVDKYHDHKYCGRSAVDGTSRMEGNDGCGHSGRKIDVISGSLRVTIRNH